MTTNTPPRTLNKPLITDAVAAALREDLGLSGDVTTNATVPENARAVAHIRSRESGIISGLAVARVTFEALDPDVKFQALIEDSAEVNAGDSIARISGSARAMLTAERVALNFVGRMSGIATLTRRYVDAVADTKAIIIDTRKTTPGLRAFEKYAVTCGGGANHRSGLFDAVLIKDNHIIAAGGLEQAITRARQACGHILKIEVEVDTLEQLEVVLKHDVDAVLLDNMKPHLLKKAVTLVAGQALTEASGGVNIETVGSIAQAGVDLISIGALTHSAPVFDVGLDFQAETD